MDHVTLGRRNVSAVCRHLALIAIDGACPEVERTLTPTFRLHLDGMDTDGSGYLALIESNHAAHTTRPPLDVVTATAAGDIVTASLEPRCLTYFRLVDEQIDELWMTVDWQVWADRLASLV